MDLISRRAAIDAMGKAQWAKERLMELPSAQPESYQEKLKEIADELSEKFAYLNTCLNERDIILGYLGVKRPSKIHCDTDCTNTKCECNHHYTKSPSAQPEIVRCKDCKFYTAYDYTGKLMCKRIGKGMILPKLEDYCSYAERIADERSD